MDTAKEMIRKTLEDARAFVAQNPSSRLSEADTKANFIEPILTALGWEGLGVVTREYYVPNSQEYIDYVMSDFDGPLLAIEAKAIHETLRDKHAAQLIQYCSVAGIEWAALTNGKELQFFNTFLTPDLSAKRVFNLSLISFTSASEFDALFFHLWQLSRKSLISETGTRAWLTQHLLDKPLRSMLLDSGSPAIKSLRRILANTGTRASHQEVSKWFQQNLVSPGGADRDWLPKATKSVEPSPQPPVVSSKNEKSDKDERPPRTTPRAHYGVQLRDLVRQGFVEAGSEIILTSGHRDIAHARVDEQGAIIWRGSSYRSVSDRTFAALLGPGRTSLNGWIHWVVVEDEGRRSLAEIRSAYLRQKSM